MGKKLIVSGADFSENALHWKKIYAHEIDYDKDWTPPYGIFLTGNIFPFVDALPEKDQLYRNHPVYGMKYKGQAEGALRIYTTTDVNKNDPDDTTPLLFELPVHVGVNDMEFPRPVRLADNEYLAFELASDVQCICYLDSSSDKTTTFGHYYYHNRIDHGSFYFNLYTFEK